jgi:glycosyltransferase involved in cell wall biosynthesis
MNSHDKKIDVSIVVPIYNNADSLSVLISQIQNEMTQNNPDLSFELVLVDDGSTDLSWETVVSNHYNLNITAIKLMRNFGQLGAMKAGYSNANGRCLISISADLQDPTELITKMINSWLRGHELVLCVRSGRDDNNFIKMTSRLAYFLLAREISKIPSGGFDVFLFSATLKDSILKLKGRFNFLQGDLLYFGHKFDTILYHRKKRPFGRSGYSFRKRLKNFQDALLDSNYTLIDFFMRVGGAISLLGFVLGFVIVLGKVLGKAPFNGFTLIACSILFIGGVQITLTGLIGQYIFRIYDAAREKPAFHIEKISKFTIN